MRPRESLTRPEFLIRLAGADLGRFSAPQRSRLLNELEAFCQDPRERLRGDMRPLPTWADVAPIQEAVRVLLEGTTLPGKPRAVARAADPAITVQDLRVAASSSAASIARASQTALREFRRVGPDLDLYSITATSAPLDVVMLLGVATLARGPVPPITRCADPHCPRKWFVARGKKRFCNSNCRVRAFVRAQRAAMREAERREAERQESERTRAKGGVRRMRRQEGAMNRRKPKRRR